MGFPSDTAGWATRGQSRYRGATALLLSCAVLLTGCGGLSSLIPVYVQQGVTLLSGSHPDSAGAAAPDTIKCDAQRRIREQFGVFITNNAADIPAVFWYPVEARGMSDEDFESLADSLLPEFAFYTRDFFENAETRYIFVADELVSDGISVAGLASYGDVLCLKYPIAFHHELYHMADHAEERRGRNNDVWPWTERDTDVPGHDVIGSLSSSNMTMGWLRGGFVNEYAGRSNVNEDQAIFFELCISNHFNQDLFRITGVAPEAYGDEAKSMALERLMQMSQLEEISPLVILKIRDVLAFHGRMVR